MAFEIIECVNPPKAGVPKVPPTGVQVSARKLGSRSGKDVRYIRLQIGAKLAKSVGLSSDKQKVILLFGSAEDAGKIRVSVPANGGGLYSQSRQGRELCDHAECRVGGGPVRSRLPDVRNREVRSAAADQRAIAAFRLQGERCDAGGGRLRR